ncbi:MAG: hypothetical protein WC285_05535 [Candidatus Gracilibacteria bacterium]|jgi:hypothetical protein
MKKLIKSIILVLILMNLGLTLSMEMAVAAEPDPCAQESSGQFQVGPQCALYKVGQWTGLPSFLTGQHKDAPGDYLQEGIGAATSPIYFALDVFRYFVSGIAIIVVIIAAIRLIAESTPEQGEKARNSIVYGIVGLLIIQLADVAVKKMFFGESGEAFTDPAMVEEFGKSSAQQIRGIIGFVNAFVGAAAVLVIIIRGMIVITSAGEEEALEKAKKHITYAILGLVSVGLSELIIRGFIFPAEGSKLPDIQTGKQVLVMITNYISGFVALGAFLTLVYAGYSYVVEGMKEETNEKVKRLFTAAVLSLILAAGAFAAVNTLVQFEVPKDTQEAIGGIKETPTGISN